MMMPPAPSPRCRLDQLLVDRGLVDSRSRAQALIRAGDVNVGGQRSDKPGLTVRRDAQVEVRAAKAWVSRGGAKLAAALEAFGIDVTGLVALDVGASTGGFTDCLLQNGARHVYAVDVGRAQLAWRLRTDPRVTCLERSDIRTVTLPEVAELAVIDVAFIGLRAVLPAVWARVAPGSPVIALIKPQFEAGRSDVGRGGIVRDPAVHRRVVTEVLAAASGAGWRVEAGLPSPILGTDGNREFLVALRRPASATDAPAEAEAISAVVERCLADAPAAQQATAG